jgi:hypothetical protein
MIIFPKIILLTKLMILYKNKTIKILKIKIKTNKIIQM